jgi:hypothetical protein
LLLQTQQKGAALLDVGTAAAVSPESFQACANIQCNAAGLLLRCC